MPVEPALELIETIVSISRVTKVTKGGRRFRISVWMAVGDGNGRVGIGHGKAAETPDAIRKASARARKNMQKVIVWQGTVPHEVVAKYGASKILIKPAGPGTGIIASQPVRAILEAAGYRNVLTKSLGSHNPINLMKATMKALTMMKDPHEVARVRGIPLEVIYRRFSSAEAVEDHADTK